MTLGFRKKIMLLLFWTLWNNHLLLVFFLYKGSSKAKRPAWDLKGRLQDMEELLNRQSSQRDSLENQLQDYNSRIASLESEKNRLYGDVQSKEEKVHGASKQIEEYRKQIRWIIILYHFQNENFLVVLLWQRLFTVSQNKNFLGGKR